MEQSPLCLHIIHTYVALHFRHFQSHKVTMTYDISQNFQMNAGIFVWNLWCINLHLIVSHVRICSFSCSPAHFPSTIVVFDLVCTPVSHPVVHLSLETLLWILPCTSLSSRTCNLQCIHPFCNRFPSPHNTCTRTHARTHAHTHRHTIKNKFSIWSLFFQKITKKMHIQ